MKRHPINRFRSPYTHDTKGKPLPEWIRNGSVAYAPMIPKPRVRKIIALP